jgi:hypothetical protein
MHSPKDSSNLPPEQRRREVAAILARGMLRLHGVHQLAPGSAAPGVPEHALESAQNGLEVSATSRPHVTCG